MNLEIIRSFVIIVNAKEYARGLKLVMEKCIIKNNNNLVGEIIRDGERYTFKRTGTEYCDGFMWKDNDGNYINEATIDHPFAIMQSRVPDKTNPRTAEWMKKIWHGKI